VAVKENETATPLVYSVPEVAARLKISRAHAFNLAATNRLPGVLKLGNRVVVSKKAIDRWLEVEDEPEEGAP
jgi:excisionase family DNA binding protein